MVLGFLVLAFLLKNDRETGLLERLCLAYPLGMGLLTLQMFLLGLMRIPLTLGYILTPLVIEIAALSWRIRSRSIPFFSAGKPGIIKELADQGLPLIQRAATGLLAAWVAAKLGSVFIETSLRPIWAWDTWANWSVGAKLFFHARSLLLDAPAGDFFGVGAVSRFGSYPLHNPLMQVWLSLWAGSFDEVFVKFTSPLYLTSLSVYLYLFMSRDIGRLASLAMVLILLGSPLLSYHAIELYSDLPLAVLLVFALAAFVRALRGRDCYWPLTGLFATLALWTKEEPLFFVLPLLLSASVHLWREGRERPGRGGRLASFLVPFALIVPWFAFKFSHTFGLGAEGVNRGFTFHPEVYLSVAANLLSLDSFNVLFVFFPLLLIAAGRPDGTFLHLVFPVVGFLAFFTLLYALTVYYFEFFNNGTVFYRNMLTIYPSVCLLDALLVKRIIERSTAASPSPAATGRIRTKKKR